MLQEIDRDLRKFDNLVGKNAGGDNVVVEKSSLQSRDIHLDYGAEFSGIIKAGVVRGVARIFNLGGPNYMLVH